MKRLHLIFVLLTVSLLTYGQNNYEKVSSYGEYQEKWALVEIGGLLGFIDQDGNEIVKPQYEKISQFGEYQEKWALVEIEGLLGFIDQEGNEIIKTKYEKIINDKKLEGIIKGKKEMIKN
jgi:cytochrome oxidase Cu insertion factor (SCO1/SenC/PrrC family)